MNNKPYYVILTGSKNNAGDYLIKYRAKEIFKKERPDRDIIDIDGWKKFDKDTLNLVNKAEALILMGGPALQRDMYPRVYPLVDDLSQITTKIVMMGVGWKSLNGTWLDTKSYRLGPKCIELLERINSDGLQSSVRDYHTKNVLNTIGFKNVLMTGCPATYVHEYFERSISVSDINKISFSLGVSFINSNEMLTQMKDTIKQLNAYCSDRNIKLEIVFHHSTKDDFLTTHGAFSKHLSEHRKFINWLECINIDWVDISGSAENLINYYKESDIHIGYRVHAHIFMNSISKPSILIAEDGRGKALRNVFGGVVIDAFSHYKNSAVDKVIRKLTSQQSFEGFAGVDSEVINELNYELKTDYNRIKVSREQINYNYVIMNRFITKLP